MIRQLSTVVLMSMPLIVAAEASGRSKIIPDGWSQISVNAEAKTRRFVSPDGRGWLIVRQSPANQSALQHHMDGIAYRAGEWITYEKRGSTWIAVSGYSGDGI